MRKTCWGKFADVDSWVEDLEVNVMPGRKSLKCREKHDAFGEGVLDLIGVIYRPACIRLKACTFVEGYPV